MSGTIQLGDYLWIRDAHITLDGTSAPGNGITLMGHPLIVYNGAHDIILRGFRHRSGWKLGNGTRNSEGGCLTIWKNCFNVLIDHVSVSGFEDEGMNVWEGCHDITIQNCIFGPGTYLNPSTGLLEHNFALLVGSGSSRVSIFRNLFAHTNYRNPAIGYDDAGGTVAPELTGDVVNNVIWEYTGFGTTVYWGGKANVIGNYYQTSAYPARTNRAVNTDANTVAAGASYAQGNFSRDGSSVSGTLSSPFPIPADALLPALDAIQAANLVKSEAGCRTGGLDPVDQELVNELKF